MIFLIDHNAERLPAIHHDRAADAFGGMFATDQMPLNQHLFFECGEVLKQFGKRILHLRKFFYARLDHLENSGALRFFRPAGK